MISAAKQTILVIDDEAIVRENVSAVLHKANYDVLTASSAEQGIEMLGQLTPALVLLDLNMPGMGGVGFLRHITSSDGSRPCPVLILSARGGAESFMRSIDVEGFVSKPCSSGELRDALAKVLGSAAPEAKTIATPSGNTVLLGEAASAVVTAIRESLAGEGLTVSAAGSASELLAEAAHATPSLVMFRRRLSGSVGSNIVELLQQMPAFGETPIMVYDTGRRRGAEPELSVTFYPGYKQLAERHDAGRLLAILDEAMRFVRRAGGRSLAQTGRFPPLFLSRKDRLMEVEV
jgi:CheY-like chemotaxis protein